MAFISILHSTDGGFDMSALTQALSDITSNFSSLIDQINETKTDLNIHTADILNLNNSVNDMKLQINSIITNMNNIPSITTISGINSQLTSLNGSITQAQSSIQVLQTTIQNLQTNNTNTSSGLLTSAQIQQELTQIQVQLNTINNTVIQNYISNTGQFIQNIMINIQTILQTNPDIQTNINNLASILNKFSLNFNNIYSKLINDLGTFTTTVNNSAITPEMMKTLNQLKNITQIVINQFTQLQQFLGYLQTVQNTIANAQGNIVTINNAILGAIQHITNMDQTLTTSVANSIYTPEMMEALTKIQLLQDKVSGISSITNTLQVLSTNNQADLTFLKTKFQELLTTFNTLNVTALQTNITEILADITTMKTNITNNTSDITTIKTHITSIQTALQAMNNNAAIDPEQIKQIIITNLPVIITHIAQHPDLLKEPNIFALLKSIVYTVINTQGVFKPSLIQAFQDPDVINAIKTIIGSTALTANILKPLLLNLLTDQEIMNNINITPAKIKTIITNLLDDQDIKVLINNMIKLNINIGSIKPLLLTLLNDQEILNTIKTLGCINISSLKPLFIQLLNDPEIINLLKNPHGITPTQLKTTLLNLMNDPAITQIISNQINNLTIKPILLNLLNDQTIIDAIKFNLTNLKTTLLTLFNDSEIKTVIINIFNPEVLKTLLVPIFNDPMVLNTLKPLVTQLITTALQNHNPQITVEILKPLMMNPVIMNIFKPLITQIITEEMCNTSPQITIGKIKPIFIALLKDSDIISALQNPDIICALQDAFTTLCTQPTNMIKFKQMFQELLQHPEIITALKTLLNNPINTNTLKPHILRLLTSDPEIYSTCSSLVESVVGNMDLSLMIMPIINSTLKDYSDDVKKMICDQIVTYMNSQLSSNAFKQQLVVDMLNHSNMEGIIENCVHMCLPQVMNNTLPDYLSQNPAVKHIIDDNIHNVLNDAVAHDPGLISLIKQLINKNINSKIWGDVIEIINKDLLYNGPISKLIQKVCENNLLNNPLLPQEFQESMHNYVNNAINQAGNKIIGDFQKNPTKLTWFMEECQNYIIKSPDLYHLIYNTIVSFWADFQDKIQYLQDQLDHMSAGGYNANNTSQMSNTALKDIYSKLNAMNIYIQELRQTIASPLARTSSETIKYMEYVPSFNHVVAYDFMNKYIGSNDMKMIYERNNNDKFDLGGPFLTMKSFKQNGMIIDNIMSHPLFGFQLFTGNKIGGQKSPLIIQADTNINNQLETGSTIVKLNQVLTPVVGIFQHNIYNQKLSTILVGTSNDSVDTVHAIITPGKIILWEFTANKHQIMKVFNMSLGTLSTYKVKDKKTIIHEQTVKIPYNNNRYTFQNNNLPIYITTNKFGSYTINITFTDTEAIELNMENLNFQSAEFSSNHKSYFVYNKHTPDVVGETPLLNPDINHMEPTECHSMYNTN